MSIAGWIVLFRVTMLSSQPIFGTDVIFSLRRFNVAACCGAFINVGTALADDHTCERIGSVIDALNLTKQFQQQVRMIGPDPGDARLSEVLNFEQRHYERRKGEESWYVQARVPVPLILDGLSTLSNCRQIRSETIDGISTTVYAYERRLPASRLTATMWVNDATSLPLKTHIVEPQTSIEGYFNFSYDSNVVEPSSAENWK